MLASVCLLPPATMSHIQGDPAPDTVTSTSPRPSSPHCPHHVPLELVRRLRALTLRLLPVEVDPESLTDPTSRVITHKVISAYRAAGGDFEHAVSHSPTPFLLQRRSALRSCRIACCALVRNSCGMQITILRIMKRTTVEVCLVPSPCSPTHTLSAVACEVLARKIVHLFPRDQLTDIMSTRYQHLQSDGDVSDPASALEMAVDQHWYVIFGI